MTFGQEGLSQPQDTQGQTRCQHALGLLSDSFSILHSHAFLVFCFMDDGSMVVNHEMCLYGMNALHVIIPQQVFEVPIIIQSAMLGKKLIAVLNLMEFHDKSKIWYM